ncbi:MAG: class I SAM-dependent methyltransferase [Pseudohongiellaceae bacterium]
MKLIKRILLIVPLLLTTVFASAQQRGQSDGINAGYLDPAMQVETWAQRFEVEGREVFDYRNEVTAVLGLAGGDRVADIGAGTGLYVPLLANAVGTSGKVYAVDISPGFITHLDSKIRENGLTQVETVLSTERSIDLLVNSVDMVFTSDAYHHFVYYQDMLASMMSALVSGGELIVMDYDISKATRMAEHVGGTVEEFTRQITEAGFVLVEDLTFPTMEETFVRRFRKP